MEECVDEMTRKIIQVSHLPNNETRRELGAGCAYKYDKVISLNGIAFDIVI